MNDSLFLAGGCLAFLVGVAAQYGGWRQWLRLPLGDPDPATRRHALASWMRFLIAWQVLVLAACAAYLVLLSSAHVGGVLWPAPAAGLVLGTGAAMQFALVAIIRTSRR